MGREADSVETARGTDASDPGLRIGSSMRTVVPAPGVLRTDIVPQWAMLQPPVNGFEASGPRPFHSVVLAHEASLPLIVSSNGGQRRLPGMDFGQGGTRNPAAKDPESGLGTDPLKPPGSGLPVFSEVETTSEKRFSHQRTSRLRTRVMATKEKMTV